MVTATGLSYHNTQSQQNCQLGSKHASTNNLSALTHPKLVYLLHGVHGNVVALRL